jgi:hypothetical protein
MRNFGFTRRGDSEHNSIYARLRQSTSTNRWTRPLAFLTLVKRVRTFQVPAERVILFYLIDADLRNHQITNGVIRRKRRLTIQFSDVNASSVRAGQHNYYGEG